MDPSNTIYALMTVWGFVALYQMVRLYIAKNTSKYNQHFYSSIPGVFTSLGVLGTFWGIYIGLKAFDTTNITTSIPPLLEGLKTAFTTSIAGIVCSIIFGKAAELVLGQVEQKQPPKPSSEAAELQRIADLLELSQIQSKDQLTQMVTHLAGIYQKQENQHSISQELLTAIEGRHKASHEHQQATQKHLVQMHESMQQNNTAVQARFQEFAALLAKSNTEALVEVMKQATEEFNAQMKELIDKLVKENFAELNSSVQQMNQWQQEHKTMVAKLTKQFSQVSSELGTTATHVKEITESTSTLTNNNSHLKKLIEALQAVMIDDTKYQQITTELTVTVNTLKKNTEAFDNTTNKLNNWVRNQMEFSDSVGKLLTRLEDIDRIKDINEVFWDNTKKQLNEGVGAVANASKQLSGDVETLNNMFYEQLNHTFTSLNTVIQRVVNKNSNGNSRR